MENVSLNKHASNYDHTPLTRNAFAAEFNDAGSSIVHAARFAEHARQILVDEGNYLGLLALDMMLTNKEGQYRKDGVTPKANHPLLVFYQFHILHENDKQNPNRKWKYLPDRPDLDKIVALIHDEGEDTKGFKPDAVRKRFEFFIENIDGYIDEHNKRFPHMHLKKPSKKQIKRMKKDIPAIIRPFDLLSRKFKGEEERGTYYENHVGLLDDARAARVKAVDKACNAATFIYRNRQLTALIPNGLDVVKYRDWVINQKEKLRDLYFIQPFGLRDAFSKKKKTKIYSGFLSAAKKRHPRSKHFFNMMRDILKTQLDIYSHNIANERIGHGSPQLRRRTEKYDSMSFSSSINVIDILINRLEEVAKIDATKDIRDPNKGIFGIPFAKQAL